MGYYKNRRELREKLVSEIFTLMTQLEITNSNKSTLEEIKSLLIKMI